MPPTPQLSVSCLLSVNICHAMSCLVCISTMVINMPWHCTALRSETTYCFVFESTFLFRCHWLFDLTLILPNWLTLSLRTSYSHQFDWHSFRLMWLRAFMKCPQTSNQCWIPLLLRHISCPALSMPLFLSVNNIPWEMHHRMQFNQRVCTALYSLLIG